jgi:transcriptional regulator with XRE-family HTH domain
MKKRKRWKRTFLREWRAYRKKTQAELAEAIDRSEWLVSKLENGRAPYTQETIEAAAAFLGCSVADLLYHDPTIVDPVFAARPGTLTDDCPKDP